MIILAIDTSNRPLSVAVLQDTQLLATVTFNYRQKDHSTTLLPLIADLLKQVDLQPSQIDRIVVAQGPGSYTGLRIGVTAAKTLAFVLKKELVGVSSLAVLAAPVQPENDETVIVPMFDARRECVFAGIYQQKNEGLVSLLADQHLALTKLIAALKKYSKIILVGQDAILFNQQIQENVHAEVVLANKVFDYPQAYQLGLLGRITNPVGIHDFVPHYLRLTQAEKYWLDHHQEKLNEPLVEKF